MNKDELVVSLNHLIDVYKQLVEINPVYQDKIETVEEIIEFIQES